jgi:hypothetical protein
MADLPPDDGKLRRVAAELANELLEGDDLERNRLEEVLAHDGLALQGDHLVDARPVDEPADAISAHVMQLFGERPELDLARDHYEQAQRAYGRGDFAAANGQFRTAYEATYNALAHALGCPADLLVVKHGSG